MKESFVTRFARQSQQKALHLHPVPDLEILPFDHEDYASKMKKKILEDERRASVSSKKEKSILFGTHNNRRNSPLPARSAKKTYAEKIVVSNKQSYADSVLPFIVRNIFRPGFHEEHTFDLRGEHIKPMKIFEQNNNFNTKIDSDEYGTKKKAVKLNSSFNKGATEETAPSSLRKIRKALLERSRPQSIHLETKRGKYAMKNNHIVKCIKPNNPCIYPQEGPRTDIEDAFELNIRRLHIQSSPRKKQLPIKIAQPLTSENWQGFGQSYLNNMSEREEENVEYFSRQRGTLGKLPFAAVPEDEGDKCAQFSPTLRSKNGNSKRHFLLNGIDNLLSEKERKGKAGQNTSFNRRVRVEINKNLPYQKGIKNSESNSKDEAPDRYNAATKAEEKVDEEEGKLVPALKKKKWHSKPRKRPKPVFKEEPVITERIKPKSRPVFIAQDYDYCFTIFSGNNSQIIKRCLEKRMDYWKEVPNYNSIFHFKWQPFSRGIRFEQLSFSQRQIVNHFEFHTEITTKDGLFRNLLAYSQLNKINVFDYVPLTFILDVDAQTYYPDFEKFERCYNIINNVKNTLDKETPNYEAQCLKMINSKLQDITFSKDRRAVTHCKAKIAETHFAGNNIWILKPTGFNRGRGISVFDSLDKLKSLIKEYSEGVLEDEVNGPLLGNHDTTFPKGKKEDIPQFDNTPCNPTISNLNNLPCMIKSKAFVIQKYIEKPLLLKGRKFDIRVWVLVTQEMKVYFFKEGYLRTSSAEYKTDSETIFNRNIHLTNNAVQKFSQNYGQFEDGNQLSFEQFQAYLDENHPEKNIDVKKNLVTQMKEYVTLSMQSVRKKLNPEDRNYCFELFGYDFFLDTQFKVWLIEVNTNPCLEESSALLKALLPRMVDDMLKLTIDQIFPKKRWRNNADPDFEKAEKVHRVPKYPDYENMWEFLCQIGMFKLTPKATFSSVQKIASKTPSAIPPLPEVLEAGTTTKATIISRPDASLPSNK